MQGGLKSTIDHKEIRRWIEERGGKPARVKDVSGGGYLLRVDFPGYSGHGSLEEVSWEEFFDQLEKNNLAFLYEEKSEKVSRFNKFISRDNA
ncbi:MAG: hypothetical protein A3A04_01865 [Candidatus Harrisonbacteria bacterium RIFCSPLOWO2_01_FULL_40_28]|uniref:1,4-alpha-glucan branching enzyme n=2 Tax=Candidatus Harrisoniibacteriota TaxID=1817905 RepID=A0A1G1ZX86_9BACT|nr:MAG: hypothetical protein A3A04_01865 [Candidatus Harrisonbacteria bacterium RIFCSPLOWO2_01_FULL_40_28]OGY69095.1 MAG: hypothetical protein A2586_01150 [Candidatus Harrisonbacteria bacterium RIFOXYD1_FULL_40_9]